MVLHHLVDMAIPNNNIPRVYANTGIEYKMIVDFVRMLSEHDSRIVIIAPTVPIKKMLEEEGYPFKSKKHAKKVGIYQRHGWTQTAQNYVYPTKNVSFACPKILRYQFTDEFKLKVDWKCCYNLKEKPLHEYSKLNDKPYSIVGVRRSEGGAKKNAKCLAFNSTGKLKNFQPLVVIDDEWEEWFIDEYKIEICDLYKPPYNFYRTGCKGCPFALNLQDELDTLEKFFPAERKQCEYIWKPVYDEYRRLHYRLK